MPLDDTQLKGLVDSNLPDATPTQQRRITAPVMRYVLKTLIDWVKGAAYSWLRVGDNVPTASQSDTIYHTGKVIVGATADDQSGALLQAPSANISTINGLPGGRLQAITSVTEANLPSTRYYPFMELAAPTGGTFDFATVEMVCKPWDAGSGEPQIIRAYFTNRGGFTYYYTTMGGLIGAGLVAVRHPDNRILFYAYADNGFKVISVKVVDMAQATTYPTFGAPLGAVPANHTVVFNSTQPAVYPPKMELGGLLTSFPLVNSDAVYPVPSTTPGTSKLTLGANYSAGSSEVSLMNANLIGGGFTFWQQLTANTKRLLASLNGNGWLGLGTLFPSERLHVDGNAFLNGTLKFPGTILGRKIVLYDSGTNNDHQYYGFGILGGTLKYQVPSPTDKHLFFAGKDPVSSKVLMAIVGSGNVGINTDTPGVPLDVYSTNPANGVVAQLLNSQGSSSGGASNNGALLQIHQGGIAIWRMGLPAGADAFVIQGWGGGVFPERVRIDSSGNMGINTTSPTSKLHLKGDTGHQQFRLETPYTPTGVTDPNGQVGQVGWDANYWYWKVSVSPHTWCRAAKAGW